MKVCGHTSSIVFHFLTTWINHVIACSHKSFIFIIQEYSNVERIYQKYLAILSSIVIQAVSVFLMLCYKHSFTYLLVQLVGHNVLNNAKLKIILSIILPSAVMYLCSLCFIFIIFMDLLQ